MRIGNKKIKYIGITPFDFCLLLDFPPITEGQNIFVTYFIPENGDANTISIVYSYDIKYEINKIN